jgi:hypothetical protein
MIADVDAGRECTESPELQEGIQPR